MKRRLKDQILIFYIRNEDTLISSLLILLNIGVFITSVTLLAQSWPYRRVKAVQYLILFAAALCVGSFFSLNVYTASSLESKIWFSRFRFLGFAFISPAGILFFSSILNRWTWLNRTWVRVFIFVPSIGTALITLGVFDQNLLVYDHAPYDHLGVSVLTFKNGPWFPVHYVWSNLLTFLALAMLLYSAIVDPKKRNDILLLFAGAAAGSIVDFYSVAWNSQLRWLMLSAGTFSISELAILYISKKNDLFGLLTAEKMKHKQLLNMFNFQKRILTLIAHDLSGNIHNQTRITHALKKKSKKNNFDMLEALAVSSHASSDLIENIMRWVKSQDGQLEPKKTHVEVHELLSNCVKILQPSFNETTINIKINSPYQPYYLSCDGEMMASIFRNIISNAIKASPRGQPIEIKVSKEKHLTQFFIQDKGEGMSPQQLQSLWNTDQEKVRSNGFGYGIGLLLARHFVELHRGKLEVISEKDKGTLVQFTIPH